jgi:hypothetical protein
MTTITPIVPELRACYGVCCDLHARCARYAAVNGSRQVEPMGTCVTDAGYPEFIERLHPEVLPFAPPVDSGVAFGRIVPGAGGVTA